MPLNPKLANIALTNDKIEFNKLELESNKLKLESNKLELESHIAKIEFCKSQIESFNSKIEFCKSQIESFNSKIEEIVEINIRNLKSRLDRPKIPLDIKALLKKIQVTLDTHIIIIKYIGDNGEEEIVLEIKKNSQGKIYLVYQDIQPTNESKYFIYDEYQISINNQKIYIFIEETISENNIYLLTIYSETGITIIDAEFN